MEAVVLVLMILVAFMTCLKLSFMKPWQALLVSAIFALFTALIWPIAIERSSNEISGWLSNQSLMLDTAVVLTLEVIFHVAYCMVSARLLYGEPAKKSTVIIYKILRFFPGVLIFAVLFYALIEVIYAFPGAEFKTVAWITAAAVLVLIPALAYGIKWLLPEKSLRLEILFLLSALVLVLGIVATVNGTTSFKGSDPVEWKALGAFIALLAVMAACGLVIGKKQIEKKSKRL